MKLRHYLFASEENDYKPWILSAPALAIFCLVIWGFRFLLPGVSVAAPGIDAGDLMSRINTERTQRFIPALITNSSLISAATGKANDMMARSYFAHVDSDGNFVWPRIEAAGYTPYLTLGENLAMDFTTAGEMISAWMNSPLHRENLLNVKFEDQGLASVEGIFAPSHDTIIAVSLFGALNKPKPIPPTVPYPTPKVPPPPYVTPYTTPVTPRPPYATPMTNPPPIQPPAPVPAPAPVVPISPLAITKNIKISTTSLSGRTLLNIDVIISGSPTLVTARIKTQSIALLAGKSAGQFLGNFTFDDDENLSALTLTVEARDKTGAKASRDFPVNIPASETSGAASEVAIPVTNEAQIITVLRIVFGVFALIYMAFLVIDAIIIHRAKVKKTGIHASPHILLLFLIAAFTLFANWF